MNIYDTSLGQALPTLPALPLLMTRLSLTFTPMLSRGPLYLSLQMSLIYRL